MSHPSPIKDELTNANTGQEQEQEQDQEQKQKQKQKQKQEQKQEQEREQVEVQKQEQNQNQVQAQIQKQEEKQEKERERKQKQEQEQERDEKLGRWRICTDQGGMHVKIFDTEEEALNYWNQIGWFWTCVLVEKTKYGECYCRRSYKPPPSMIIEAFGSVHNSNLLKLMLHNAEAGYIANLDWRLNTRRSTGTVFHFF